MSTNTVQQPAERQAGLPPLPAALQAAPSLVYIKGCTLGSPSTSAWVPGSGADQVKTQQIVADMLAKIEAGGEAACLEYAAKFDKWTKPTVLLAPAEIDAAVAALPDSVKQDVQFQYQRVFEFARAQVASIHSFETDLYPGVVTGQKVVPVNCVGCYVPGGRFSHISSAIMTCATAKASGVKTVVACSPAFADTQMIHPATLYAMKLCGCDYILCMGGVQAVAAMAFGLFTGVEAEVIVGPGNKFVAEAKRSLLGRVGIDMIAGPTEIMVLADHMADALLVAADLVSQAEHGTNSPAWLITTDRVLAVRVMELMPALIADLERRQPGSATAVSWRDYGEVILVNSREEMAALSDLYAAEHLEVQCSDLDWWLATLRNYGSLFLGEETCVSYGDKTSGPNHVLPTKRVSRYSGGLSADKFLKKLTYQKMSRDCDEIAVRTARISRAEGMEGHALAGDARLAKYFKGRPFDLASSEADKAVVAKFRDLFERNSKL